ncbi:hypothetical protein QS257_20740 [Terrilactibacillus sp. S3-3]|nr:hypothetical protein QS257_20740 [Terrilactibacillus sp. S3-3]
MGFSATLDSVFRAISGKTATIAEQLNQLRRAESDLHSNQQASKHQLKLLASPDLGSDWQGTRARRFDQERDQAEDQMKKHLTQDVDSYLQAIETKIRQLEAEHDALMARFASERLGNDGPGKRAFG